jgi:hypothetical protein
VHFVFVQPVIINSEQGRKRGIVGQAGVVPSLVFKANIGFVDQFVVEVNFVINFAGLLVIAF